MTDARFLCCKANHVKIKAFMQGNGRISLKSNNWRNRSRGLPYVAKVLKAGNVLLFSGRGTHRSAPIQVKIRTAKRNHVPLECAKVHQNQCNDFTLRGETADIRPLSKYNTVNLQTKCKHIFVPTGSKRC